MPVKDGSHANNRVESEAKSKGTIEYALRPYRIPTDVLREEHGAVLGMVTKLLGVTPRHCSYLMLWPPGYETMSVLVPNLFNIPFCDFGLGTINGELRSLAAYVTSRSYGCGYCSAHCAALGTIWRGDSLFLGKNAMAMHPNPPSSVFTAQELATINISKKVGNVPCDLQAEDIRQMASVLVPWEQEAVVNCTAVMGFLNRFMDTIGMTLEMEQIEIGETHLAESGWKAGIAYDPEADAELMEDDKIEAIKREELNKNSGIWTFLKMLFGAKRADSVSLAKIPTTDKAITARCREVAGFVPFYLTKMLHTNARWAFAWTFLLRLNEGSEEVPVQLKQIMGYIVATNVSNTILRAHFAFMAFRNGVSMQRLINATNGESLDDTLSAKEVAAITLAEATSFTPSTMTPTLAGLLTRQYTPSGVIELLITVSVTFMYHRWTAVYVPMTYEPEVAAFVKEHGKALGIDPVRPCTDEQATFEAVAARERTKAQKE